MLLGDITSGTQVLVDRGPSARRLGYEVRVPLPLGWRSHVQHPFLDRSRWHRMPATGAMSVHVGSIVVPPAEQQVRAPPAGGWEPNWERAGVRTVGHRRLRRRTQLAGTDVKLDVFAPQGSA